MRRRKRQPPKATILKKSFFQLKRLYEYSTFLSKCLLVGFRVVNRCQSPIKKYIGVGTMHQNQDLGLAAENENHPKRPETGSTLIG